jgi:phospholipid transport system substrate-binding protein
MRRAIAGLIGALALGVAAAAPTPPDEVVKKTTGMLQEAIKSHQAEYKADPKLFYKVVDEICTPHFDMAYIAQLILARNYRSASEEQRKRFQEAFKNMMIRSYANALLTYADSLTTEWQPSRMAADATETQVNSQIKRPNGPPLPMGFAMRLKDNEWKVYDIIVENLSLVTNFRSQVTSEIKRSSLDAVIAKLETGDGLGAGK